jgi:drug/metabolite transporter (DMT)-like permease
VNCAPPAAGPSGSSAASAETRSHAFKIGVTLAVSNTIIGAGQPALTRWGATNLDPLLFCTGAVVVAALFCVVFIYSRDELKLVFGRRFRLQLATMSAIGTMATSLLLTFGMTQVNAIATTILLQSEPIYSLVLAVIVVRERPSNRQLLATATILVGIASVFASRGAFSPAWAALLVLITPLFWQTSHVMGLSMMPPLSPLTVTSGRMIYAALGLGALLTLTRPATLPELANPAALAIIGVTGFFVYFLSALTWYGAISRLSLAWTTALVVPAIPLLSILFAIVFLGERATAREILGVLIAIAGVLALVLGADAHRKDPVGDTAEAIHQPLT